MRLLLVFILTSTVVAGLGCSNRDKRIPIRQGKGGEENVRVDDKTSLPLSVAFQKSGCLNLNEIWSFLKERDTARVSIYISDLDIGTMEDSTAKNEDDESVPEFTVDENAGARACTFLKGGVKPEFQIVYGKDIEKVNSLKHLLGAAQTKCEGLEFSKNKEDIFTIEKKGLGAMTVKNVAGTEYRQYVMKTADQLTVNVYSRDGNRTLKHSYIVSWGEGTDRVSLRRGFAAMLNESLEAPVEFSDIVNGKVVAQVKTPGTHKGRRKRVSQPLTGNTGAPKAAPSNRSLIEVSTSLYEFVLKSKIKNLTCN